MKIGIMGGTFNPIHYSHLIIAKQALTHFNLDKILFMPNRQPAYKSTKEIVSAQDRSYMIKKAIKNEPLFEFSDLELKREGNTYTADTVIELNKLYPNDEFYFIMGGDSIKEFMTWNKPDVILKEVSLIASGRAGLSTEEVLGYINSIRDTYTNDDFIPKIYYLPAPLMFLSSHLIRDYVSVGRSIDYYCPPGVVDYIKEKKLYQKSILDNIRDVLQSRLSPSRYSHTLGVCEVSVTLAECYGYSLYKAYLAALLHDNAKHLKGQQIIEAANAHEVELSELDKELSDALIHSKLGAKLASEEFGIDDIDIINAIYYHTTGRPNMSLLEKIIFVADYIEPSRNMQTKPSLDVIRSLASTDIDRAVLFELKNSISYLESKNNAIDAMTLESYKYYERICNE